MTEPERAAAPGPIQCPSSRCEPGALLLGLVQSNGRVALFEEPLEVDEAFVAEARLGRKPERRFRFAGNCAKAGCRQWTGTRCGVVDKVLEQLSPLPAAPLPPCALRPSCRWFLQAGAEACGACVWVITDLREDVPELEGAGATAGT